MIWGYPYFWKHPYTNRLTSSSPLKVFSPRFWKGSAPIGESFKNKNVSQVVAKGDVGNIWKHGETTTKKRHKIMLKQRIRGKNEFIRCFNLVLRYHDCCEDCCLFAFFATSLLMLERMIGYFNACSISIRSMKSVAKTPRRLKIFRVIFG